MSAGRLVSGSRSGSPMTLPRGMCDGPASGQTGPPWGGSRGGSRPAGLATRGAQARPSPFGNSPSRARASGHIWHHRFERMCPHRFAATRGIRRGARPASGLSWESVEARSLEESGGEDSERPASKKTGPPQDGRARLRTDRLASERRRVALLEELDDGVEGDAHARPEVVAPLSTGESQSQFWQRVSDFSPKVANSWYTVHPCCTRGILDELETKWSSSNSFVCTYEKRVV